MNTRVERMIVYANVRIIGAIGVFERRKFDLMLTVGATPEKRRREAISTLGQIGYELGRAAIDIVEPKSVSNA